MRQSTRIKQGNGGNDTKTEGEVWDRDLGVLTLEIVVGWTSAEGSEKSQ